MQANRTIACNWHDHTHAPIPPQVSLITIVVVFSVGFILTRKPLVCFGRQKIRRATSLSAWLDLTTGELAALFLWFSLSATPVIVAGIKGTVLSTAKLVGTEIVITLAVLLVPATRTSLLVRVFGMPFDRAIRFHRYLAWWAIGLMWTHFGLNFAAVGSCILGDIPDGFTAMLIFTAMSLMSLEVFRRHCFEVFRFAHWLFIPAFLAAIIHTGGGLLIYCGAPFFLYAYDRLRRFQRSRVSWGVASLTTVGDVTQVKLGVPPSGFAHAPGQFCFINIPAVSKYQWHPFSITSPPQTLTGDKPYITLNVKVMGDGSWTRSLQQLALKRALASESAASESPSLIPLEARVDGPFGTLSARVDAHRHVILVGGGIGATPLLSILQDLCSPSRKSACERVTFVWVVRSTSDLDWCRSTLETLSTVSAPALELHLYVTKGDFQPLATSLRLRLQSGRPDVASIIKQAASMPPQPQVVVTVVSNPASVAVEPQAQSSTANTRPNEGYCDSAPLVVACGPALLVAQARKVCLEEGYDFVDESFLF